MKLLVLSAFLALVGAAACDSSSGSGGTASPVAKGDPAAAPLGAGDAGAKPGARLADTPPGGRMDKPTVDPEVAAADLPPPRPELLDPAKANAQAPATFKAKFETTKGDFTVEVTRAWSPNGADRFYNLVKIGFFEDIAFFRAVEGFMVQFGIHGHPQVAKQWMTASIPDDTVEQSNAPGYLTFAKTNRPNSRSTQLFISYGDNERLDKMGFSPIGKVVEGMETVNALNKEYGEAPSAKQPNIQAEGNAFLRREFPNLDYIKKATLLP